MMSVLLLSTTLRAAAQVTGAANNLFERSQWERNQRQAQHLLASF